jgi:hypothetical protein
VHAGEDRDGGVNGVVYLHVRLSVVRADYPADVLDGPPLAPAAGRGDTLGTDTSCSYSWTLWTSRSRAWSRK